MASATIKVDADWFRLVAYTHVLKRIAELQDWDSAEAVQLARAVLDALPPEPVQ